MQEVSVMCRWYICSDKWCLFCEPEGVYIVFVQSRLWILTTGFNQSSWGESGKYSSPVWLRLVGVCYSLSVRGLRLVLEVTCLVMKKMIQRLGCWSRQAGMVCFPSGSCYRPMFLCVFFMVFVPYSMTFATDPRVVHLVTGSVPVEHPHYFDLLIQYDIYLLTCIWNDGYNMMRQY